MKIATVLISAAWLLSCSGKSTISESPDSTGVDTTTFIDESDSLFVTAADAPDIANAVAQLIREFNNASNSGQTIRLSASGYEYQTDEVWSFDSLSNLSACVQDWSSEGTEGKSYHLFRNEMLYAVRDENFYGDNKEVSVYHRELGGVSFADDGTSPDSTAKPLEKKYFVDTERDLKMRLSEMVSLLRENKQRITKSDPATLLLVNESEDENMPGKETTEITIDQKLLDDLLK
jgi:hypothetical protein